MNQVSFHFAPPAGPHAAPHPGPGAGPAAAAPVVTAPHGDASPPARHRSLDDPAEAIGFDHARYGRVPPADSLWPGHPVREGWERGRRLLARRERPATLAVRRWLALRLAAWQKGQPFDDHQITPHALRALETATHCPVTGVPLDEAAVVVALDPGQGWVGGNLALLAPAAAGVLAGMDWPAACAQLAIAEAAAPGRAPGPFGLDEWRRAVALKSLVQPLDHAEAAAIPLHVLPPNRLRLANPIQALQALLTLQLAAPGWGQRTRRVAQALPEPMRPEFNLFFHTLLARALQQGHRPERAAMRAALEQAWGHAAVQRRWARFAGGLGGVQAEALVARLARVPLPGLAVLRHADGIALDV